MAELKLSNGAVALVDKADLAMLSAWKWRQHAAGYPYRTVRKRGGWTNLYMHRLLLPPEEGEEVDHINRNPLDNRMANLRSVPHWRNAHNRQSRPAKSGVRGVCQPKGRRKWRAVIYINRRCIQIGNFETKQEAVDARRAAERQHGV